MRALLRIGILDNGLEQERTIISVQKDQEADIDLLAEKVSEFLRHSLNGNGKDRQFQLAVLAKLVVELIQQNG